MKEKTHGLDLTQGRVSTLLLRFCVPFVIANLVNTIYGIVGMIIVGQFTDAATMSGVSTGTQIINLTFSFTAGLGTGGTVLLGRCIGERNKEGGTRAAGSYFLVSAGVVAFLTLFIWFFREPLLDLMKTQPTARPSATRYVMLCTIGVPFNVGFGMLSAVFRGMGNSNAPSIVAGISFAAPIASVFSLLVCVSYILWQERKYKNTLPQPSGAA